MAKMWSGRTDGQTAGIADDFNSSISFDSRMYAQDIRGSIAHAKMLGSRGIIPADSAERIAAALEGIASDVASGALAIDPGAEDIHMFVEQVLTERIGDEGKMLHTARSRNDQVALDTRLWCADRIAELKKKLVRLENVLCGIAGANSDCIMPGYTHLQRAQPINFGHHMMAYAAMFLRDLDRLNDCLRRVRVSPIGCGALAGTTFDTDRRMEADLLGLPELAFNSLDGVSDRDFCIELVSDVSMIMMHLSRFSEELIMWSSWEFKFIELSDDFTTGSSIMPQKKNPDMAELVRGKTGRVYGDLVTLLTMMKGLPLAYNKDMQEDKPALFDAVDNLEMCLDVFTPMIEGMKVLPDNMRSAAGKGFINATDLADYLVGKGMPFRTAYKISGSVVADCIARGLTLEEYPLDDYRAKSELIEADVFDAVNIDNCMHRRRSEGGPGGDNVARQIALVKARLSEISDE